ncbi:hypothetical protein AOX55_0000675 [Sinorhizobium fredii CCBAU 25509]|nr:hypothetical protein AOX55_0000675 [Sinorhizobium fredii CCBAU 25509]
MDGVYTYPPCAVRRQRCTPLCPAGHLPHKGEIGQKHGFPRHQGRRCRNCRSDRSKREVIG